MAFKGKETVPIGEIVAPGDEFCKVRIMADNMQNVIEIPSSVLVVRKLPTNEVVHDKAIDAIMKTWRYVKEDAGSVCLFCNAQNYEDKTPFIHKPGCIVDDLEARTK